MLRTFSTTVFSTFLAVGYAGLGCSRTPQAPMASTEGQLVEQRANAMKQKAELMQKGERMIVDGRGMVARGKAISDQGNALEGRNLVAEGEAKIRQGENYTAQADAMILPTTQPTRPYSDRGELDRANENARNESLNK